MIASLRDGYIRRFRVVRVVDGDTLLADTDMGFYLRQVVHVRLARIDTPEKYGPKARPEEARAAERFTTAWLTEHRHGAPLDALLLQSWGMDGWQRWVAEVQCLLGHNLSDDLLFAGLAVPYTRDLAKGGL